MLVNLPLLLVAIALLWFPRRWLRLGMLLTRRRRSKGSLAQIVEPWRSREPGDPRVSFFAEFTKFRNFVDLLRAGAGSILLFGGVGLPASLELAPAAPRSAVLQMAAICAPVLIIGVLIQMVRREKKRRLSFYPPVFYLAGMTIGPAGPDSAACAFALAWAFNLGLPNAQALLSVYALLLFSVSALFTGRVGFWPSFASCLIFLPVLLSLMARKPLQILVRKAPRTASPT